MANKKFSEFELKTTTSNVSHIVGYNGAENVRITPANFISGSGGPFLPLAGGIMVGNTTHNDNVKSIYGTSGDGLQIYHDGSNSYIVDSGTGGLNLLANSDFAVKSYGTDEPFISAATNAFVKLFFDGSEKLATTSTGISVTGDGTFSGDVIADTHFNSSDSNVTLSTTGAGNVFLRPNGKSDTTGQVLVNQSGELKIDSDDATLILKGSDTGSSLINFSDASDGNVGRIYYDHQNNFMQFKTNDSERMRLDSSGKLGLGVNTNISGTITMPNSGLISFHDANGQGRNSLQFVSGELKHGAAGSGLTTQTFFTDGDERMRLDSSGNLGINDSVGYGKLAIKTSGTFTFDSNDLDYSGVNILMKTTNTATDAVGSGMVWLKGNNVSRKVAAITNYTYGDTDQSGLNFYVQPSAGGSAGVLTEALRITNDGDLGVGTPTPESILHITQASSNAQLILERKNTATGKYQIYTNTNNLYFNNLVSSIIPLTILDNGSIGMGNLDPDVNLEISGDGVNYPKLKLSNPSQTGRYLQIGMIDAVEHTIEANGGSTFLTFKTESTEKMRLTSSGALQVGGTDTGYSSTLIQTGSFSSSQSGINILTNSTGYAYMLFGKGSGSDLYRGQIAYKQGDDFMAFQTAGTEKMRITDSGVLGIGTTGLFSFGSGSQSGTFIQQSSYMGISIASGQTAALILRRLEDGTLQRFYNSNSVVGSISVAGSATAYNTSSDYRLKEDLQDFKGLDLVSKIPVYDYKWKADESRSYGVLAHQLQEVLPQAVTGEKDAEEMQSVDYSKIVPLLVKSIQELTAKVEKLELNK